MKMNKWTWPLFLGLALIWMDQSLAFEGQEEDYTSSQYIQSVCRDKSNYNMCVTHLSRCVSDHASPDDDLTSAVKQQIAICQGNALYNLTDASSNNSSPSVTQPSTSTANGGALYKKCEDDTEAAKQFCTNPIKAVTDMDANSDSAGMFGQIAMMGGSMMTGQPSQLAICNMMMAGGGGMSALNAGLATRCGSLISTCEKSCDAVKADPFRKEDAEKQKSICSAQRRRMAEFGTTAVMNAQAGLAGKLCGDAARIASKPLYTGPPIIAPSGGIDCTNAANSAHPFCRPLNPTPLPGGGPGYGAGYQGKGQDGFDVGGNDDLLKQDPKLGANNLGEVKAAGIPNGGGQMLGGGDKPNFGGGDEKNRGGPGGGHNTNVLQGERAGGGYAGGAINTGGGWAGYGNGSETEKRDKGFDLSKFLPGQKNAPVRGPAGLGRASAEIAPMHEDIFKKISDRVQVVCKTNRLYCD